MRKVFMAVLLLVIFTACKQNKPPDPNISSAEPVRIELSISGMMCMGCVETVRSSIAQLPGIDTVNVSLDKSNAIVAYKSHEIDSVKIRKAVEINGYKVTGTKLAVGVQ